MNRWFPHPILSVLLLSIWLLLVNQLSFGQVLIGLLLGWSIPLYTARFWPEPVRVRRPGLVLRFTLVVLYDIVVANVVVARLILGRPQKLQPRFLVMPLELRSELAISLLASTISLTPGTVSTFLSSDRRCLIVHTLHTTDPDGLVATMRKRYEAPLREILEG